MNITQERLKQLVTYNPDSGIFYRKTTFGKSIAGNETGTKSMYGYLLITIDRKSYRAHRLAWLYMYGCIPNGHIDHINGIRTDNRIKNLREADYFKNAWNSKVQKNNTTGVKGVSFNKKSRLYDASVCKNNKRYYVGGFKTLDEAKIAIEEFREYLHGEFVNHG